MKHELSVRTVMGKGISYGECSCGWRYKIDHSEVFAYSSKMYERMEYFARMMNDEWMRHVNGAAP